MLARGTFQQCAYNITAFLTLFTDTQSIYQNDSLYFIYVYRCRKFSEFNSAVTQGAILEVKESNRFQEI